MRVELDARSARGRFAYLRPLNGHDELWLDPDAVGASTWLLQRLLKDPSGAEANTVSVGALDVGNRDRLLAGVYTACFGERIDAVARCANCGADYELGFALGELGQQRGEAPAIDIEGPDETGFYRWQAMRFRLPTVGDLDAVRALPPAEAPSALLLRCIEAPPGAIDEESVQQAMERLAPSFDIDIDAQCPICGAPQIVAFSLESFLLRALSRERRFLTLEIHRLATAYGWSLDDILKLSRDDRRTLVRQVERERAAGGSP
jgi:hypothetical protein